MKRLLLLMISLTAVLSTVNAGAVEYPDWQGFPPMYTIQDMVEFNGTLFCACKGGLFRYNPQTREYTLYYKNHGLLSNDILAVAATLNYLYLGFTNAGLVRFDPVTEQYEQILFPEYTANRNKINVTKIFAMNDSVLYIGHSKGVDKINVYTKELRTFSKLGKYISENSPVSDVKVIKGKIYVCTEFGLAVADESNPDLEFYGNWKNYTYGSSRFNCIERVVDEYDDTIWIGTTGDGILFFNEDINAIQPSGITSGNFYSITKAFDTPCAASNNGLYKKFIRSWYSYDATYLGLKSIVFGSDGNLWVGTSQAGLKCYTSDGYTEIPSVGGPRNSTFYNFYLSDNDNVLWTTTSRKGENYDALVLRYDNVIWTEYREEEGILHTTVDITGDNNGNYWLPSWGKGLYVMTDIGIPDKSTVHVEKVDPAGDIIKYTIGKNFIVCSDLVKDKYGNIWVANHQAQETNSGAVVFDGYPFTKHQTYSPDEDGIASAEIMCMDADNDGWIWLGTYQSGLTGVYVGDDPFDKFDTYTVNLNLDNGLLGMLITTINHDLYGDIWVGTKGGLNRIKKLPDKRLKVEDLSTLLEGGSVEVTSIEVDKYDNKWIGTSVGGLFKIDAKNEAAGHYTTQNSGLFSDMILSLKYDNTHDVLWVGTDTGLNKFYALGTTPEKSDTEIHVFPNPFEIWGTNSFVTFTNLKLMSNIRIYSFNGELVDELVADQSGNSGSAYTLWYGKNFKDETVGSGIYFFTGITTNGRLFKDKMAVIRR
ncbi:hypothetical protein LLG96_10860 [bacterium]|nr:hypothetical protein [bacterium]